MERSSKIEPPIRAAATAFARILVPVDFSASSRRALATALLLRQSFGSEVHLFRVTEQGGNDEFLAGIGGDPVTPRELVEDAKGRLHRFVENVLPGHGADVTVHAHMGADVVHGIERVAKELGATLVLLASPTQHSLLRTDVEKLTRDLDCAVMVLAVPEDE